MASDRAAETDRGGAAPLAGRPPESLGATIRGRRREAGLTLQQVADRADLSVSYLSQLERNLLTPSLSTLKRIATILSIPAGQLMFRPERGAGPSVAIVRRGERKRLSFPASAIGYEMLTPDMRRRASLLWVVAPPDSKSGPAFAHEGEDGVVVLRGELHIEVGEVWHVLGTGDSIYFNAELPHRWHNAGQETAEAIWLSTPPSF